MITPAAMEMMAPATVVSTRSLHGPRQEGPGSVQNTQHRSRPNDPKNNATASSHLGSFL